MDTNSIDINTIIGICGSLVAFETRIREAIKQITQKHSKHKIKKVKLGTESYKLDQCSINAIEKFINEKSFKKSDLESVFSKSEKQKFIDGFFENNEEFYSEKDITTDVLNEYLDQIEESINNLLTDGEKVIVAKLSCMNDSFDDKFDEILKDTKDIKTRMEKQEVQNIFKDSDYGSLIIELLNMVFIEIEKNTSEKLLKIMLKTNSLEAEIFEDVVFKIQKALNQIDKERIENITGQNFDNGLYALNFYIQYIASDFSANLNEIFSKNTQLVIDIIYNYEHKNPEYYLTLGAIGLRNDYTDETIYLSVMSGLISYLKQLLEVIKEKWRYRNYEYLDSVAVEEMHKRLWNQIRFSININNKKWILEIINNDNITDVELANMFNITVKYLRKELYEATKTFLNHSYINDYSTKLSIGRYYKAVLLEKLSNEVNG